MFSLSLYCMKTDLPNLDISQSAVSISFYFSVPVIFPRTSPPTYFTGGKTLWRCLKNLRNLQVHMTGVLLGISIGVTHFGNRPCALWGPHLTSSCFILWIPVLQALGVSLDSCFLSLILLLAVNSMSYFLIFIFLSFFSCFYPDCMYPITFQLYPLSKFIQCVCMHVCMYVWVSVCVCVY